MKRFGVQAVLVAISLASAASAVEGDFHWRKALAPGKTVEIKGVNGDIVAQAATGREVEVRADKEAGRGDAASVRIEAVEHEGGVTICAVYPTTDSRANECKPGKGGRMNVRNNDVKVRFTVRVPAGVTFVGRTVNGKVETTALPADAEAHSVNGDIRLETAGWAQASSVNGSITASFGRSGAARPAEFSSVNGPVTLHLPARYGAELDFKTVNGKITSDLPMTVQGKLGDRLMSGRLGAGGPRLAVSTVNGNIELKTP